MLEHLLEFIGSLGLWAYLIIFVLVVCESSLFLGFVVPGAAAAIFGGFLAEQGTLDPLVLWCVVFAGAIIGNIIGYESGRRMHRPWVLHHGARFGLRADHLKRADSLFRRHGGKALVLGRLSQVPRALVPFVAGATHFRYSKFILYTVLGALLWTTIVVLEGYLAGASWRVVERWVGRIGLIVVLAPIVIAVLVALYYRKFHRRRA